MTDLVLFRPRANRSSEANVRAFVRWCREELTIFGADLDFDAVRWDVTQVARKRASSSREGIHFSRLGESRGDVPMREPFGAFARAYFRYLQGLSPTMCLGSRLHALRALEMALCTEAPRPEAHLTTPATLDAAAALLRAHLVPHGAYAAALQLERLASFLDVNRLVAVPLQWKSSLRRPVPPRLGPEFEERRAKKLPSRAALEALAEAFNRASEPCDVIVASAAALQFCTHSRISEVLTLPNRCEITRLGSDGKSEHALRWWPAKGGKPCTKWLLPSMAPIAARALEKIRRITAGARSIARWYEAHPSSLYLPPELEHLRRREYITYRDLSAIMGQGGKPGWALRLPYRWGAVREGTTRPPKEFRFAEAEAELLSMLPRELPAFDTHTGITFSEALFVIPWGLFQRRPASPFMIERVSVGQMNAGLGCRTHIAGSHTSMFERLGLTEDDGTPIRFPSHNIRHYLSDLAQRNEVSQLDLAAWAGRKPEQNLAYNHQSDAERLAHVRTMMGSRSTWRGPLSEIATRMPVERSAFAALSAPTIHTTEIGYCLHDYAMLPCQLHRDCLFCTEHICIKGDAVRANTVKNWLSESTALLAAARKAMSRRAFGADRWVSHCRQATERLSQLRALLEDPSIPDGTVIQLGAGTVPSRIRDAVRERGLQEPLPKTGRALPGRRAGAGP